jgi:hypothetical protein
MSIAISKETEARLAAEARRLGISEDALVVRFLSQHAALTDPRNRPPCRSGISAGRALFIGETSTPIYTFNTADFEAFAGLSIVAP